MGLPIHNIEMIPGKGGQMVRTAGGAANVMSRDEGYAQVRLPSGEIRKINENCYATIGQVGNTEHENVVLGKAGTSAVIVAFVRLAAVWPKPGGPSERWRCRQVQGRRWLVSSLTRLGACSPRVTRLATQRKNSNRFILVRRDGRPMKQK